MLFKQKSSVPLPTPTCEATDVNCGKLQKALFPFLSAQEVISSAQQWVSGQAASSCGLFPPLNDHQVSFLLKECLELGWALAPFLGA